jgi:hypothetical protein
MKVVTRKLKGEAYEVNLDNIPYIAAKLQDAIDAKYLTSYHVHVEVNNSLEITFTDEIADKEDSCYVASMHDWVVFYDIGIVEVENNNDFHDKYREYEE